MFSKESEASQRSFTIASPALRGVLWMVFAQVLFSAMGVFTRIGAQKETIPIEMA
jgi:hypothetical protein